MPYNQTARNYDELHSEEQLRKLRIISTELQLPATALVLDVGCGTGLSASLPWRMVGIDPARKMLRQAAIPVVEGTAEALPFSHSSCDAVICVTAFHHFAQPEQALAEMQRVSKGPVVISLLKKAQDFRQQKRLVEDMLRITHAVDDMHDLVLFSQVVRGMPT